MVDVVVATGTCGSITSPNSTFYNLSTSAGSCQMITINLGYGEIVYKIDLYQDGSSCANPSYCSFTSRTGFITTLNCSSGSNFSWSCCSGTDQAYVDWNNSCSLDD